MISFWTRLLNLIAPPVCCVCGQRLSVHEYVVCSSCLLQLHYTRFWEQPLDNPLTQRFFLQMPIERGASLFFYNRSSSQRHIVLQLKYNQNREAGIAMGRYAAKTFGTDFFHGIDGIVAVPLTKERKWQRGYNQSELIARGVSEETGIPVIDDAVERLRFDGSQTHRWTAERRLNVKGAFRLTNPQRVSGKHILLIDDVVTTGSTLRECGQQLALAGNVKISVMSLACTLL